MDGLSAAATVLQLLQVAAQVSSAFGQYVSAMKDAESSRSKLVDQITLITTAAKAVGSVLQNPPSSRTPEQQALLQEWLSREGSAARCKKELEDLLSWLHDEVNSNKPTQRVKRLLWPVKENKIRAAIRAFEGHMPTSVIYYRSTLQFTSMIRNREIATAKRTLLEWFDGLDCTVKHEFTREQRQKTTGEWLFNERLYTEWRESSFGLFWLSGKAGAGKSVLARSGVIDYLSSRLADDETLAYFYCDFRNPRSMSTMEVLRSLTKQLLWKSETDWLPSFPVLVVRKERGTGPPVDITTLFDLLKRAAGLHQRPMIVIDTLDECEDFSKLLDELVKLEKVCRLFVTSRPLHSLNRVFASRPSISLDDRVDAVRNDMCCHISTELESRDKLKILSHDLQEEIRDALMEKADGMFRWVQCQLDRLNGCWSLGDLREVLDTLPATLYETYDHMLRAINKQEFGGRVARRALMWLLAEALRIDRDNAVSSIPTMHETDIIEICGSLLSFNEQTRIITLSHTVSSFDLLYHVLRSINPDVDRPDLSSYAIDTGLNHLANCAPEDDEPLLALLFTFRTTSRTTVAATRASGGLDVNIEATVRIDRDILSLPPLIAAAYNQKYQEELLTLLLAWRCTVPRNAIHSFLRSNESGACKPFIIQTLLQHGADAVLLEARGENCLHSLLRGGNVYPEYSNDVFAIAPVRCSTSRVVDFLIDKGAELPDDVVNYCVTGLPYIRHGSAMSSLVRLVTVYGASCQAHTTRGDSALHCLLSEDMVLWQPPEEPVEQFSFLLENGCDFHATGSLGLTVLGTAIMNGYLSIARILLDRFAQSHADIILTGPDPGDAQGNTFLHRLCYKPKYSFGRVVTDTNFLDRVKLLQEAGYDLFGAKFSDVIPLFLDNLEWASDLPWYSDATEAYQQTLAKPKITFDDVDRVYHLLVDHCKLPVPVVRHIMETAEYWAHTTALRENLSISSYGSEPIALPVVSSIDTQCWMPCRVRFACKLRAIDHCHVSLENVPLEPPRTVFRVSDEYIHAVQPNGRERLAVKDLTCGDSLSLVFSPWEDVSGRVELEFIQIDMYFTMRATDDSPSFSESL
ncbi:hypothetical protein BU15DRAFT_68666 [Melanogaster broomeanus]|nr:hypothetical protein BU15DRAFT_68666 [Melanogaster broomeanus]